jgi:hypothetical protein
MKIHETLNWKCLTPEPGHYFFGYYDNRYPWSADKSMHLALRVDQCGRVPERGEKADVGYVTADGHGFVKLAETRAWCHQQGAMTLWLRHKKDSFIYNDFDGGKNRLCARIFEVGKGVSGEYELPVYALSPDGKWGASLNFGLNPRRGYSYADAPLPQAPRPDLDSDGIFIMNMLTGENKLIISYRQLMALHPVPYDMEDKRWWTDHIIFNSDSTKLLFLFRGCADGPEPWPWTTNMFTANIDGSDLACVLPQFYWSGMISHQIWGHGPREVLVDANWRGKGHEYVVFDERERMPRARLVSRGMGPMGHLVYSPDGKWMLADTYPQNGAQSLALVKCHSGELRIIGEFRHEQPPGTPVDVRCDLHPRWSADGSLVTVDSIRTGERKIHMLELSAAAF